MSSVVGIDFDTFGVHLVAIDEDDETILGYDHRVFPGKDSFSRLRTVRSVLPRTYFRDVGAVLVGIEDPRATNPLLRSMIGKLARVQGAILQSIPERVRVEPLNAKEWRVAVGLSGNAKKDEVAEWAVENSLGDVMLAGVRQDAYDAYAIARAVAALADGRWERPPPKPRKRKKED